MDLNHKEIFTEEFQTKLRKIQDLLEEAYNHIPEEDRYFKSAEGSIEIMLSPFFWIHSKRPCISIYSYALGPHRMHYFSNIDQALVAVEKWHQMEMTGIDLEDRESGLR